MSSRYSSDRYGRVWRLPTEELCDICGQPDNCGDCTHAPYVDDEVDLMLDGPSLPPANRRPTPLSPLPHEQH